MKRSQVFIVAFTTVLMLSCVTGCKEKKPGDEATSEAVKSTTGVIDKNISATVKDSVVILRGEVMDEATMTAAIKAVTHIEGVKTVQSYLTVKPVVVAPGKNSEPVSISKDSL